jgi:hypothetical protein
MTKTTYQYLTIDVRLLDCGEHSDADIEAAVEEYLYRKYSTVDPSDDPDWRKSYSIAKVVHREPGEPRPKERIYRAVYGWDGHEDYTWDDVFFGEIEPSDDPNTIDLDAEEFADSLRRAKERG